MQVGTQVDHFLTGTGSLVQFALLHQNVAKQAKIERQPTLSNERASERLGLFETVKIVEHMAAQEHSFRTAGMGCLQACSALFGEFVVARIKTFAGLGDKSPAEPLDGHVTILPLADLFLHVDDFLVDPASSGMRDERERQRVRLFISDGGIRFGAGGIGLAAGNSCQTNQKYDYRFHILFFEVGQSTLFLGFVNSAFASSYVCRLGTDAGIFYIRKRC